MPIEVWISGWTVTYDGSRGDTKLIQCRSTNEVYVSIVVFSKKGRNIWPLTLVPQRTNSLEIPNHHGVQKKEPLYDVTNGKCRASFQYPSTLSMILHQLLRKRYFANNFPLPSRPVQQLKKIRENIIAIKRKKWLRQQERWRRPRLVGHDEWRARSTDLHMTTVHI